MRYFFFLHNLDNVSGLQNATSRSFYAVSDKHGSCPHCTSAAQIKKQFKTGLIEKNVNNLPDYWCSALHRYKGEPTSLTPARPCTSTAPASLYPTCPNVGCLKGEHCADLSASVSHGPFVRAQWGSQGGHAVPACEQGSLMAP